MNNEKSNFYKSLFLFEDEVQILVNGIITAQNYYGDKKDGTSSRDTFCNARIEELERVFNKLDSAVWKELPEPTKEI